MPYISKEQRAQGPYAPDGLPGTAYDVPKQEVLCGHYEGGGTCGVLTEKRYLIGWRCPRHTPAAVAGRPETRPDPARSSEALRARVMPSNNKGDRYGPAGTRDHAGRLGRDGKLRKASDVPT